LNAVNGNARVIDFGNGQENDNVVLLMYGAQTVKELVLTGSSRSDGAENSVSPKVWHYISVVQSGNTGSFYIDGQLSTTYTIRQPTNIVRKFNYIGKSNWDWDPKANAVYDDIEIYKGALTANDIKAKYQAAISQGKK